MDDLTKAVAVDGDPDMRYAYVPITKRDDSTRMVEGIISGAEVDLDGQIVDQEWLKSALPQWMVFGNIRAQHDPKRPVGKATELDMTHPDGPWMRAKIVDDAAWKLCQEGVYSGFSIGIKGPTILKDARAPQGRVRGRAVCEVSVVDHPSYQGAFLISPSSPPTMKATLCLTRPPRPRKPPTSRPPSTLWRPPARPRAMPRIPRMTLHPRLRKPKPLPPNSPRAFMPTITCGLMASWRTLCTHTHRARAWRRSTTSTAPPAATISASAATVQPVPR
jgi:hypothetical protein